MPPAKVAGIVIVSVELSRSSNPSAEGIIQADLVGAVSKFIDQQFIDPSNTAVAGVHPGSILTGVTPIASVDPATDLGAMVDAIITAGGALTNPALVMHPQNAVKIALAGAATFPTVGIAGGTLFGVAVLTSSSVPVDIVALIDQTEILLADDGQVSLDVSTDGAVQMNSTPSAGAQALVSLWQNNLIGIRAERQIAWAPRRDPEAVAAYVNGVSY